jgi:hypothetical protein
VTAHPLTDAYLAQLRAEFPRFRLVPKSESALSHWIDAALRLITLGGQRQFMSHYHTVIGETLYVPAAWRHTADVDRVIVLRHERVHLLQRRRYGTLGMALLYLLPWFPLGLAYGRARLEWEAYVETLHATRELKGAGAVRGPELRREILRRFVGPDYGWMWPFPKQVGSWYDAALAALDGAPAKACPPVQDLDSMRPDSMPDGTEQEGRS